MSEWLKEHAWKAILAIRTKRHRNTSSRTRFNDLLSQDAARCASVNDGIRSWFRKHLTQFTRFRFELNDRLSVEVRKEEFLTALTENGGILVLDVTR